MILKRREKDVIAYSDKEGKNIKDGLYGKTIDVINETSSGLLSRLTSWIKLNDAYNKDSSIDQFERDIENI